MVYTGEGTHTHNTVSGLRQKYMLQKLPIRFEGFKSIEVQDTESDTSDNSSGCIPHLIHSENLVYMVYYRQE
jgi:hypothetical protein